MDKWADTLVDPAWRAKLLQSSSGSSAGGGSPLLEMCVLGGGLPSFLRQHVWLTVLADEIKATATGQPLPPRFGAADATAIDALPLHPLHERVRTLSRDSTISPIPWSKCKRHANSDVSNALFPLETLSYRSTVHCRPRLARGITRRTIRHSSLSAPAFARRQTQRDACERVCRHTVWQQHKQQRCREIQRRRLGGACVHVCTKIHRLEF